MSDDHTTVYLTPEEVAQRLRLQEQTIRKWRHQKIGPPFLRFHGRVRYRLEDVEAWERAEDLERQLKSTRLDEPNGASGEE